MSNLILCLSFISQIQAGAPPEQATKILKNRVIHQWQNHRPDVALDFDNPECQNKGTATFKDNLLQLTATSEGGNGTQKLHYSDLLDGRKIDFYGVSHSPVLKNPTPVPQNNQLKKWLPWGLAIAGIGLSAFLIHERNTHIRELRGLKLQF